MITTDFDYFSKRTYLKVACNGYTCYCTLTACDSIEYSFNIYADKWKTARLNLYAAFKCLRGNAPSGTPYGYFNIRTPDGKKTRLQVTL